MLALFHRFNFRICWESMFIVFMLCTVLSMLNSQYVHVYGYVPKFLLFLPVRDGNEFVYLLFMQCLFVWLITIVPFRMHLKLKPFLAFVTIGTSLATASLQWYSFPGAGRGTILLEVISHLIVLVCWGAYLYVCTREA